MAWLSTAFSDAAAPANSPRPFPGSIRPITLYLGAVHDAARRSVERIAPVHHAAIVPQDQIAGSPLLIPGEFVARRVLPQRVEQRLAVGERKTGDIGVAAAAEIQRLSARHRMGADNRMLGTHGLRRVGCVDIAAAQFTGAVAA